MDNSAVYSDAIDYFLQMTGGRWKLPVIFVLSRTGVMRYGALKRCLNGVTDKMFSTQLKELERDGLIHCKQYNQVPPKVEYSLTEKGKSLLPVLYAMHNWGSEQMKNEAAESDFARSGLNYRQLMKNSGETQSK